MTPRTLWKMLAMTPSILTGPRVPDLKRIEALTRETFPKVPRITPEALEDLVRTESSSLLVVDVRSTAEYEVSHLPGAINLQSASQIAKCMNENAAASRTVLYCSVGFRSARLANQLAQQGVPGAMNLEGSIFRWANEGRALFRGETPTRKVHPYARRWAGLLEPGLASEA